MYVPATRKPRDFVTFHSPNRPIRIAASGALTGLIDSNKASIHTALRSHGQASDDPAVLAEQLSTFNGGCAPTCGNLQAATFEPLHLIILVDANGDGQFDQLDIVEVLLAGKYLTGQPATFSEVDWNADDIFDQHDIITALKTGSYRKGPEAVFRTFGAEVDQVIETVSYSKRTSNSNLCDPLSLVALESKAISDAVYTT